MDLVSCECCGVVLDRRRLKFPEDIYREDESLNTARWGYPLGWPHPHSLCPLPPLPCLHL